MFRNNYVAPSSSSNSTIDDYHINTRVQDYDLNFEFPVEVLESCGVRLDPFIPSIHGKEAFQLFLKVDPEETLHTWLPYCRPRSLNEFLTWLEFTIRSTSAACLWLITDLSRPNNTTMKKCEEEDELKSDSNRWAGWIALIRSSEQDLCTEIGHVTIFKRAQRTHVQTHATSLLLQYCLEVDPLGLALRRVQWSANTLNVPSNRAAQRLGFQFEGTLRHHMSLSNDKIMGNVVAIDPNGSEESTKGYGRPTKSKSRDTNIWSMTYQDWITGGCREKIQQLLDRPVERNPAWTA